MRLVALVVFACCAVAPDVFAAEVEPEWKEPVQRVTNLIADLSAGEIEAAWQKFRVMLPEPPLSPQTPFDPDPFEKFQQQFNGFPRELESLSLIGERRYSPQSRRLYFLAEGKLGPVMIEAFAFKHKGEWFFLHFGYMQMAFADASWYKEHEDWFRLVKHPEPIVIELPKPAVTEQAMTE